MATVTGIAVWWGNSIGNRLQRIHWTENDANQQSDKERLEMEGNNSTSDPGLQYCDNCQGPLPIAGKFCPHCGTLRPVQASPLGPKTLGGIFEGTFQIYATGFVGIVIIVALVQVPLSLLGFWLESVLESAVVELIEDFNDDAPIDFSRVIEIFRSAFYVGGILLIATWLTSILMAGALIYGVSGQILGRQIRVVRAYSFTISRFGAMLGASFLAGLAVILMAITIIGVPFAIFFGVRWYFVMQTASLERCGPLIALARSSDLVRGNWWRVFGILLLIGIVLAIANGIASASLGFIPYVGPMVVAILFAPVWIIAQTLLYHDLRVRRDGQLGYDVEVLASELRSPSAL